MSTPFGLLYKAVKKEFFDRSRKFDRKQRAEQVERLFGEMLEPSDRSVWKL